MGHQQDPWLQDRAAAGQRASLLDTDISALLLYCSVDESSVFVSPVFLHVSQVLQDTQQSFSRTLVHERQSLHLLYEETFRNMMHHLLSLVSLYFCLLWEDKD